MPARGGRMEIFMIRQLSINNIAVISNANIDWEKGFTVLTGETGAGKSIIIDSLNMLKGERISKDIIRHGENKASVYATLDVNDDAAKEILEQTGIEVCDNEIMISREINADGKNNIRIDGMPATLSMLKMVGDILINIHGQHDNTSLLSKKTHITFLDKFAGDDVLSLKQKYSSINEEYKNTEQKLNSLMGDDAQKAQRLELLNFQIEEIENASLTIGEEQTLTERQTVLSNMQTIAESVGKAYSALYESGDDYSPSALDAMWGGINEIEKSSGFDPALADIHKSLQDAAYEIDDSVRNLKRYMDSLSYDKEELDEIENRLDLIYNLKRKYGNSIESILEYYDKISEEASTITNSEQLIEELSEKLSALKLSRLEAANKLSEARCDAGVVLSKRIMEELSQLDMSKVRFAVNIERCDYRNDGCDDVEFVICTNVGDDFKPLTKIASGGELSRIMLAIKSVLSNQGSCDTLIFDEIDTGVSGRAAQSLAVKLYDMSNMAQVICITHLPQIAAMADNHLLIEKTSDDISTKTTVTALDEKRRIDEIARTLGGATISDITRQNAAELILQAKKYKNN